MTLLCFGILKWLKFHFNLQKFFLAWFRLFRPALKNNLSFLGIIVTRNLTSLNYHYTGVSTQVIRCLIFTLSFFLSLPTLMYMKFVHVFFTHHKLHKKLFIFADQKTFNFTGIYFRELEKNIFCQNLFLRFDEKFAKVAKIFFPQKFLTLKYLPTFLHIPVFL